LVFVRGFLADAGGWRLAAGGWRLVKGNPGSLGLTLLDDSMLTLSAKRPGGNPSPG